MTARYKASSIKALEVILFIAEKKKPEPFDFYHILKINFFADKYHLNNYGRPVVGDTYVPLNHGPVAETMYKILKQDALEMQALHEYHAGSNVHEAFEVQDRYWVHPKRSYYQNILSDSDTEALNWAYDKYASMSFRELEDLTHEEIGWKDAYFGGSAMIKYEHMLDESDELDAKKKDIQEVAAFMTF